MGYIQSDSSRGRREECDVYDFLILGEETTLTTADETKFDIVFVKRNGRGRG